MKRPNILVLCSDQQHPLMTGYRGHPFVRTPNLDRLAGEGTHFTRAYCNSPLCVPSRMSFITGKYVHQIGAWSNCVPLDPAEMTWPRRLDQAGVASTMLGKMDFCGQYQDGGFTDHRIIRRRPAFREYPMRLPAKAKLLGYDRPDKRRHVFSSGTRSEQLISDGDLKWENDDAVGNFDHDRIVTDWALDYLRQKGAEKSPPPWALYVGLLFPHWPFCVPERYFHMYPPDQIEWPVDARFPNPDLHPALQYYQNTLGLDGLDEETLRRTVAVYYGMITCLDEMIGEILRELAAQGLADDTCVIFTSDHGEMLGEHGLFYKKTPYEGSAGVPLIVRGPGLPAGQRIDRPVSLVDLYPTVLDLAGLTPESDRPGRSWLPLITGRDDGRPDWAFSEYYGMMIRRNWAMLVRGGYKYVHYVKERPSLFNLGTDPHEMNDLAADPRQGELMKDFGRLLRTIVDPEAIDLRSKRDLGLIAPDGTDYTDALTVEQAQAMG